MLSSIRLLLLTLLLLSGEIMLYSQGKAVNRDKYRINISRTSEAMKIDGVLDEKSWQVTEPAENFIPVTPIDGKTRAPDYLQPEQIDHHRPAISDCH